MLVTDKNAKIGNNINVKNVGAPSIAEAIIAAAHSMALVIDNFLRFLDIPCLLPDCLGQI